MLIHVVNNGAQVLADRMPGVAGQLHSPLVVGLALLGTVLGAWLVRGSRRVRPEPDRPLPVPLAGPS